MYEKTYMGIGLITGYTCMGITRAIQIETIKIFNNNCADSYSLSPYNNIERSYEPKVGDKVELYYCSSNSGGSIMFKPIKDNE